MPESSYTRWAMPVVIVAVAVMLAILAFTFRDQITTFVRFSPEQQSSAASITVISCIDEGQDGNCDGDLGRVGVNLQLIQPSGAVETASTDLSSGQFTFSDVEYGAHELQTLLPFPGIVRSENPQVVRVPAPSGQETSGIEVTVFVAVSLTGESSVEVQKIMTNPITHSSIKEGDPIPGQRLMFDILVRTNRNEEPITLDVTDIFDSQCLERIEKVTPVAAQEGNILQWNLTNVKARYARRLSYIGVVRDLDEILPRTCTNNVAVTDASGATVGSTSLTFTIGPVPDRAVLDLGIDDRDLNGGVLKKGDAIQYDLRVKNIGRRDAASVVYRSDFPEALENPEIVEAPRGAVVNIQTTGGQNGTGFIEISNFGSTAGDTVRLAFKGTIKTDARLFTSLAMTGTVEDEQGGSTFARIRHKVGQVIELLQAAS
jgi:hypothetical protein